MKKTDLKDEDVIVKISSCNACKGIVRTAIKHMTGEQNKKEFMKEVLKHDLSVNDISLLEYRKTHFDWCNCSNLINTKKC